MKASDFKRAVKECLTCLLIQINGNTVLSFEYDRINKSETVFDSQHDDLITTYYDATGKVVRIEPRHTIGGLSITYNRQGRVTRWSRGVTNMSFVYDDNGRLVERHFDARTKLQYRYDNGDKVCAPTLKCLQ